MSFRSMEIHGAEASFSSYFNGQLLRTRGTGRGKEDDEDGMKVISYGISWELMSIRNLGRLYYALTTKNSDFAQIRYKWKKIKR